tara:strand:- start:61 stop:489 length:429 start_codon:yes stop_codon:yes gene_type:complete
MFIITNLFLQSIFISLSLIIGVPGIDSLNLLKNKLILFVGIFIFQILTKSISKISTRCKTNIKYVIFDSFFIGLMSIIGYSIYIDLSIMNYSKSFMSMYTSNKLYNAITISVVISLFTFIIKMFQIMFNGEIDICQNDDDIY